MIKRSRKSKKELTPWNEAQQYKGPANPIQQRDTNNTNLNGQANIWTGEPEVALVIKTV